jgi:hypothetical protein
MIKKASHFSEQGMHISVGRTYPRSFIAQFHGLAESKQEVGSEEGIHHQKLYP